METNRILTAAISWLIAILACSQVLAQEALPDSLGQLPESVADSASLNVSNPDSTFILPDSVIWPVHIIDTSSAAQSTAPLDSIKPSVYDKRLYISKSPADETKGIHDIFLMNPGPVGSPIIPIEYLNVAGTEISVNGMPFIYNGIYRPYMMGTDLNVIPWEILSDLQSSQNSSGGLDFRLGPPADKINRSDIEIGRGPYGYDSSRWRFFRPFGNKTYAYFTVGFKKSDGYLENSNFNSNHVTFGISRQIKKGEFSVNLWRHRVRTGLNSFDFLLPQNSRQSRGLDRGEAKYITSLNNRALDITAFYQRSAQTISGYNTNLLKSKYDIGGGRITLTDTLGSLSPDCGIEYYRLMLNNLGGSKRRANVINLKFGVVVSLQKFDYNARIYYAYNSIDKSALLPSAEISYDLSGSLAAFAGISRTRMTPDLLLLNLDDNVSGLGQSQLQSYHFIGNPNLEFPLSTQLTSGLRTRWGDIETELGVSYKRINSQITLAYNDDSSFNFTATPYNFDDRYLEIYGKSSGHKGPFSGEIWGAFRKWSDKYFSDGLEKGPQALGFGRLSFERGFFVPRLFLGGSLEARAASRRDYRSIANGFTDAFITLSGRLEFRYKDLTFWLNEDNLANSAYITWWPYYEQPRTVWWGLRWVFFD